jgi:hypothetical protein
MTPTFPLMYLSEYFSTFIWFNKSLQHTYDGSFLHLAIDDGVCFRSSLGPSGQNFFSR